MKLRQWQNTFHKHYKQIANANSIVQHVNEIKNGKMKHVFVRMGSI